MLKIFIKLLWVLQWITATLALLVVVFAIYAKSALLLEPPSSPQNFKPEKLVFTKDFRQYGKSWLKKNSEGLWEMYLTGSAYERGVAHGAMAKDLVEYQELLFVNQMRELIGSDSWLQFLKYFVSWMNRDIDKYFSEEYKSEVLGISKFASKKFDVFVWPAYQRMLNYHAAHDIGHMVQNMHLAGCTSFAAWGRKTPDSLIISGRNFDFYSGDEFMKNKMVCFVNPEKGFNFAFITWAGMIGVVSGMNEQGLTITINAAPSTIPGSAKTPVSILAREILQYCKNTTEAFKLASERKTFVSESFLITSSSENKAVIIEKSIDTTVCFTSPDLLLCTNHFQSPQLKNTEVNKEHVEQSASPYRYGRLNELLQATGKVTPAVSAKILRNTQGFKNSEIGFGNEKSINQFIAHHSVIFKPSAGNMWVSTQPFQNGKYLCYHLCRVFCQADTIYKENFVPELTIAADSVLVAKSSGYLSYKSLVNKANKISKGKLSGYLSIQEIASLLAFNPQYFLSYFTLGEYYQSLHCNSLAKQYYNYALKLEIPTLGERDKIINCLHEVSK